MTHDNRNEHCKQIATLLAYPGVGPLSASAIAINLGTVEQEIQAAIESLLREGRIVQLSDGRLASTSAQSQGRTPSSEPADKQSVGLERRGRG